MAGNDWSDEENDQIVADYFSMLKKELASQPYVKAEHRRNLIGRLHGRNSGSIEFKHQNISAAMDLLGQPKILGYKSLYNYQASLLDAIIRWLNHNPDWMSFGHELAKSAARFQVADSPILWIGPPPTLQNQPPPYDPKFAAAVARKYDVAERDARNRALGKAGEERVLRNEITLLKAAKRDDLASKVRWTAQQDGDGAGYDILSFEADGQERLIEVKTTNGWERTPFHITRNEINVADTYREKWHLIRLWNFARDPKAFAIRPPLDAHISLTPTSFLAQIH